MKWLSLVVVGMVLVVQPWTAVAQQCTMGDTDKRDCGYIGINQNQCQANGCCWQPSSSAGVPWCFFPAAAPAPPMPPSGSPPFNASELGLMRAYFRANLNYQNTGATLASPSATSPSGFSYRYDWARDAALSNHALQITANSPNDYDNVLQKYAIWVVGRQADSDPHGIDVRIEPKFELNGSVYAGSWCRPQNDGPGLRAIALIGYALDIIPRGGMDFVRELLWTGSSGSYNGGAIKYDLDWITQGWNQNTCDLWEEVQSSSFFWNLYTSRRALLIGVDFAKRMNDTASAAAYARAAQDLNSTLASHLGNGFVIESSNRPQDSAVVCAFNNGDMADGVFSLSGAEVAGTISTLANAFHNEYPINSQDDKTLGVPGVLFGRYPGDVYGGGNPWVLCSACVAETLYRASKEMMSRNSVEVLAESRWRTALQYMNYNTTLLRAGDAVGLARALVSTGDGILLRIRYHVAGGGFHLPEQLDKNTGYETSVNDLTWSYAALFKAMAQRPTAFKLHTEI